ncbi:MAG: methyltransferase domain-containing protein [Candidatus Dormibacter sp.]
MDQGRDRGRTNLTDSLDQVYAQRFPESSAMERGKLWRPVVRYLQRFIDRPGAVLDLACDHGDFIRNIQAEEKWATDIRDVSGFLPKDVQFVRADGLALAEHLPNRHFDAIFMSNYLEHLPDPGDVIRQFEVCARLLRRGGRVIVLQPNIRLVGGRYWDFIDHKVALTERSLTEAAGLAGFETVKLIVRFLPYTTQSRLPHHPALVSGYLRLPLAWRVMGKQTLYVGGAR